MEVGLKSEKQVNVVYKICTLETWANFQETGILPRAGLDKDFIHFSKNEEQAEKVIRKFFKGEEKVVILEVDVQKLEGDLRFECNPGGSTIYPHLYNAELKIAAVLNSDVRKF